MYEAMRQRAPHSSKLAGVSATAICLGLATWALLSGFGEQLVKVIQKRTTFVTVPPTPSEPVEPAEKKFEIDIDFPAPPIPPLPLEQLETFKPPIAQPTQTEGSTESTANIPPPLAPVRKWPAMKTTEKPEYPPQSIRLKEEGETGLLLCVSVNGRVTSASLASSSGFPRLDEAALKWVRGVRFAPGTLSGAAQAMCGHKVTYDWNLEDARR